MTANEEKVKEYINEQISQERIFTPDYLWQQFNLPRERWDRSFREMIEEKTRNNQIAIEESEAVIRKERVMEIVEDAPGQDRKDTFNRYMRGLGFSPDDLRNKRLLDLGCAEGEFVEYLIRNDITQDAYGLDDNLKEFVIAKDLKDHFFIHDYQKVFPVGGFDYVVSVGAVSNAVWAGKVMQQVEEIIKNGLMAIKEDGEIRIYPIQRVANDSELFGLIRSYEQWIDILTKMSQKGGMTYRIEPKDVKVMGKDDDLVLESVLIVKRETKS